MSVPYTIRANKEDSGATVPYSVIVPTIYGQVIVNRNDINQANALIKTGAAFDVEEINFVLQLLQYASKGAIALDIGACFGVYTLACAKALAPLGGLVHAFEPQRMLAYMICGSVALNSIENAIVHHACVGDATVDIDIPNFDYNKPLNFGSVEFGETQRYELDQQRAPSIEKVKQVRIDDFALGNVRFMKIDVEGMEYAVLQGAKKTIERERPAVLIEYLKSDKEQLAAFFCALDYAIWNWSGNLLCIQKSEAARFSGSLKGYKRVDPGK